MITNVINTKALRKASQHNWFAPLSIAALIGISQFHAHAGLLDKIVKVERKGDSVGVSVNPLGIFGADKKVDERSSSPAAELAHGAAEAPIPSQDQNENSGFTQATLPNGVSRSANLPTSATNWTTTHIAREPEVAASPDISSPNQTQTERVSSDAATAGLTPREVVESAAWAEFKKTWRLEGESWITTKWVNPRGVFEQKTFQWMVSDELVSDRGCELKNLRCEVEEQTLSDLQKLNGTTARWTVTFSTQYYRLRTPSGWAKWCEPEWSVLFLVFESKDGGRPKMLNATPVWRP